MRTRSRRLAGLAGAAAVILSSTAGTAAPATAAPAPADSLPPVISPGDTLEPGEFYPEADMVGGIEGWRFTGQGDGQTTTWTADLDDSTVAHCGARPTDLLGASLVGIMQRDGVGRWGGRVLRVRLYVSGQDQQLHPERELTGEQLLTCIRAVHPEVPAGTLFTVTSDKLGYWAPAAVGAPDGSVDLVTSGLNLANALGYQVARFVPGQGWQPSATIGGLGGPPAVVRLPDGTLRIFVVGNAGSIRTGAPLYSADVSTDRRFLGWHNWGGRLDNSVAPVLMPDGSVGVYGTSPNGRLYQAVWARSGQFRGWTNLGVPDTRTFGSPPTIFGAPAATGTGSGRVTVLANLGFKVFERAYLPGHGWGAWQVQPDWGTAPMTPLAMAAVSPSPRVVDLYWSDNLDGSTLHSVHTRRITDGRWGPQEVLSGRVTQLSASVRAGRTDLWGTGVLANGTERGTYQRTMAGGRWGAWTRLPYG